MLCTKNHRVSYVLQLIKYFTYICWYYFYFEILIIFTIDYYFMLIPELLQKL